MFRSPLPKAVHDIVDADTEKDEDEEEVADEGSEGHAEDHGKQEGEVHRQHQRQRLECVLPQYVVQRYSGFSLRGVPCCLI